MRYILHFDIFTIKEQFVGLGVAEFQGVLRRSSYTVYS